MPVNPYDDRKVSLRRPHGKGDLDIVGASYTRRKANVTKALIRKTHLKMMSAACKGQKTVLTNHEVHIRRSPYLKLFNSSPAMPVSPAMKMLSAEVIPIRQILILAYCVQTVWTHI